MPLLLSWQRHRFVRVGVSASLGFVGVGVSRPGAKVSILSQTKLGRELTGKACSLVFRESEVCSVARHSIIFRSMYCMLLFSLTSLLSACFSSLFSGLAPYIFSWSWSLDIAYLSCCLKSPFFSSPGCLMVPRLICSPVCLHDLPGLCYAIWALSRRVTSPRRTAPA